MSNSSMDYDVLLSEINNGKAKLFIPVFIYVGILMLVGILGNGLVVYFYGVKSKKSPPTSFIIALAMFDLVSCIVGMPMEIADLRYTINFESKGACKVLRFVTHFASISSGLTLIVIAIDRYRRICKPFAKQFNNSHVRTACVLVGVFSVVLSWPAFVFNDVVEFDLNNHHGADLKGHDCTTTRDDNLRPYMFAINIIYLVAFLMITITLAVLYTLIGQQLLRHKKFRFYVAKKGSREMPISLNNSSNASSDENLLTPQAVVTVVESSFEKLPDASVGHVLDSRASVEAHMLSMDWVETNADIERENSDVDEDSIQYHSSSCKAETPNSNGAAENNSYKGNLETHNQNLDTEENLADVYSAKRDDHDKHADDNTVTLSVPIEIQRYRWSSQNTDLSKVAKSSYKSRNHVISRGSNLTNTSSVTSGANTLKTFKQFMSNSFTSGKSINRDVDTVKELRMKLLDIHTIKYTMIMLVITVVFVVSFMPYLALVIWRSYNDEHEVNTMTDVELVLFQIGIRSVFLNSALNPVIYGGFNSKFRAFFYGAFCPCLIKIKEEKTMTKGQTRDQSDSTSGM